MTRFQDYADWILINAGIFLHFGLTGTSAFDPAKNDPLSRAVLGEHSLEDGIDGFPGIDLESGVSRDNRPTGITGSK